MGGDGFEPQVPGDLHGGGEFWTPPKLGVEGDGAEVSAFCDVLYVLMGHKAAADGLDADEDRFAAGEQGLNAAVMLGRAAFVLVRGEMEGPCGEVQGVERGVDLAGGRDAVDYLGRRWGGLGVAESWYGGGHGCEHLASVHVACSVLIWIFFSLGSLSLVVQNLVAQGATLHNGGEGLFFHLSYGRFVKDGSGKSDYQFPGLIEFDALPNQIQRHVKRIHHSFFLAFGFQRFIIFYRKPLPVRSTFFKGSTDLSNYFPYGQGQRCGIDYLESYFYRQLRVELTRGIEESFAMFRPNKLHGDPLTQVSFLKVRLSSNCPKSFEGHDASPASNNRQHPVWNICRGVELAPLVRFGLLGVLLLFAGTFWYLWKRQRLALGLVGLGFLSLFAPTPYDLGSCRDDARQKESSEYRQTFQHNAVIVPRLEA